MCNAEVLLDGSVLFVLQCIYLILYKNFLDWPIGAQMVMILDVARSHREESSERPSHYNRIAANQLRKPVQSVKSKSNTIILQYVITNMQKASDDA